MFLVYKMLLPASAITIADVGDGEGCPSDAVRAREALLRRGFANLSATATAIATTTAPWKIEVFKNITPVGATDTFLKLGIS